MSDIFYRDHNYKVTIINYKFNNMLIYSEEILTFNSKTINLNIPAGYVLAKSPIINIGEENTIEVQRSILTNTLLFIDNVTGEVIHRQNFTGYTGDIIDKNKINLPYGYSIVDKSDIIINSARTKRIMVDNNIIPWTPLNPQRVLHKVTIKYMFNTELIGTELISIRGWRKPTITFPTGYKAKVSTYFDGWNPNKPEFIIEVLPKLQRINIEVRDKRNNVVIRNISKDVPYNSKFDPRWVTDIVKGFKIETDGYNHEIIQSSGNFTVYGVLEQYWSVNVPFKEGLTGDLKDDINMPEVTFTKSEMIANTRAKAKKIFIWKYPGRLTGSTEALFSLHNSISALEINNLIKELRSDNENNLQTVTDVVSDKEMRVKVNKIMKNDLFFNRIIDINTYNKIDLFALEEFSYNSIEDYHVSDALDSITAYNERYLEYTMKFPFGYMITNIKEDNIYHSIMRDIVFYNEASDRTSVIKFDISTYNALISKINEYIDMVINLKTNVAAGYTSPHLLLHEDLIAIANGRILRDLQNVPSNINLVSIPEYIGMNAYGRLNVNIAKLRLAILNDDVQGLIINRLKFRKSDIPNDHELDPNFTWIYDDYGYLTWDNATKLIQLIQDIYNLAGNLTISEGNQGNIELLAIHELNVATYNRTLMGKTYDLFYHNMNNMIETILSEERRNHILENNAVNSLQYCWGRLRANLPRLMSKFKLDDITDITADVFKKFVYPFFSIFEILYTVAENKHTYANIYKDYTYYRNEAKKTNWLSKQDDLLIRNIIKDISRVITIFRKYYKGGGTFEFYKNVIEKVCHTPLYTKDIQAFNGFACIDNIAKLNRPLDYRPAIYLDDIYPQNAPIKRLAWFGSIEIAINNSFTYSYFINDKHFDNIYTNPSHTWIDLIIDYDTKLDDHNVNWYKDPNDEDEIKTTRYLTLEERIYKLITYVMRNNAVLLDRYINLINNFYSSVEDPIKYGWHKIHLKHINLDDRLIRTMGTFIDVHTMLQNVQYEVKKITDTTKPYIFSNTMSIEDNSSEYVNAKIQYKNEINSPKIVCSLFAIYDSNLHIAKVECNSDGIPIRVFTTVYGNRKCKPVFIAPINSDSTLVIKSGISFTLNCSTAEVIASKINNADINKYDKNVILDSKYNGDIIWNHTGETPTDKTIIWGSNENKTIYSKLETVGEIDELATIPEFTDLLVEYNGPKDPLKPGYSLESIIDKRNVIAKKRFWNDDYSESFFASIDGTNIIKKQLININVINNNDTIYNDNMEWEDINILTNGIEIKVSPHETRSKEFSFTATFVDKNGQQIPESEQIGRKLNVETTVEGKLNFRWVKRHPERLRYIPKNGIFWSVGAEYYIEIIDGDNGVHIINGTVTAEDVNNGYIEYNIGQMPEGDVISTFIIQETGKFRSIATINQYEQLEVLPDEYFIVKNINLLVEDQLMNKEILNSLVDYEKSISGKVTIKGNELPLVLFPNIKIDVDTLAPYVRIKISPSDNDNMTWEYTFAQDRLNYKYNYQKPIVLINEVNTKSIYDFIKNIGTYANYDSKINSFYDLYPNTFIAKPGKSYKIVVETCDFDGTDLNSYEYTKIFIDNHLDNVDSSKFLKNSTDNTYLPNAVIYPDGNDKFVWIYNDIDKPLISNTKIFGVTKESGNLVELPKYDSLSNMNGEYIGISDMETIEYGEYIKWTIDKNIGFPALERDETYLRNERISPSLISASLDVSLNAKDGNDDDNADYYINSSFTHKYIRDPNTKIAVQLYIIKNGVEKKLDTKVVTFGEYNKTGYVSFPREDSITDDSITFKTKIALIKNIQIGPEVDTIEYLDSPRNKVEYSETFERTALPFFDKKPNDIMVLAEPKIRIRKAIGESYAVGSMILLEIYDKDNQLLVEKEFTIKNEDVIKGEIVHDLDKTIPTIFTFHIYAQEPGKLPALPYVTSAYYDGWKIDKHEPKINTKIIDINFGSCTEIMTECHARYKITYKTYAYDPNKPKCNIKMKDLVNKLVDWKTDLSENVSIERIPIPKNKKYQKAEHWLTTIVEYKETGMTYPLLNPIVKTDYCGYSKNINDYHWQTEIIREPEVYEGTKGPFDPDNTNFRNIDGIRALGWGYKDMVHDSTDTRIPWDTEFDLISLEENVNNIFDDEEGKYVMLFPVCRYFTNENRYDKINYPLIYGYRIQNKSSKQVYGEITVKYNRWRLDNNYKIRLIDLWNAKPGDKHIANNPDILIENLIKPSDEEINSISGLDTSKSFENNVGIMLTRFFLENSLYGGVHKVNWTVVDNNYPVDSHGTILYNMIVEYTNSYMDSDIDKNRRKEVGYEFDIRNGSTFVPILKPAINYYWRDIKTYQSGYDEITKELRFHIGWDKDNNNIETLTRKITYKKFRDGRKASASILDILNHSHSTIHTYINDDMWLKKSSPDNKGKSTINIVGYKPERKSVATIYREDIYGWITDKNKVKHDMDNKWNSEDMPDSVNNIPIKYMFIPTEDKWTDSALVNSHFIVMDELENTTDFYGISKDFRGTYLNKLYNEYKNIPTTADLTLKCWLKPFNICFKYGTDNKDAYKTYSPSKRKIIKLRNIPLGTTINGAFLTNSVHYKQTELFMVLDASTHIFELTTDKELDIPFEYIGVYSKSDETPLKFTDSTDVNESKNSITVIEFDNFVNLINDVVDPYEINSNLIFSQSDLSVEYEPVNIPNYDINKDDSQYDKFNNNYIMKMKITGNLSDISNKIDKDTEYTITVNTWSPYTNKVGDDLNETVTELDLYIGDASSMQITTKYQISRWSAIKIDNLAISSSVSWDYEFTKNNPNKLKFILNNPSKNDFIYVWMYDKDKNNINAGIYNIEYEILDTDKNLGYKIIDIPYDNKLYEKATIVYYSETRDANGIIYYPSKVKCETRSLSNVPLQMTNLVLKFKVKNIINAKKYKVISGLVGDNYDNRTEDDWNRMSANNSIKIHGTEFTGTNDQLKSFEFNIENMTLLNKDNLQLPVNVKLAKDNWINENNKSIELIPGRKNEVIVEILISPPENKYEINDDIELNMDGFGLVNNGTTIKLLDNSIVSVKRKSNNITSNDYPVELRFFMYCNNNNYKKFYALYVWMPYGNMSKDNIKNMTFLDLLNNIEKFEYRFVKQEYKTDNAYKPVCPTSSVNTFIQILPMVKRLEQLSNNTVQIRDISINTLKNIATNAYIGQPVSQMFIVPEIQRLISKSQDGKNQRIFAPVILGSKGIITMNKSLQLDKLQAAMVNYSRFIEANETPTFENSRYKPVNVKNYRKYIVEFINTYNITDNNDNYIIEVALTDISNGNNLQIFNRHQTRSPWFYVNAMPTYKQGNAELQYPNNMDAIITYTYATKNPHDIMIRKTFLDIIGNLLEDKSLSNSKKVLDILVKFRPELDAIKSKINTDVLKEATEMIFVQSFANINDSNIYEPNLIVDSMQILSKEYKNKTLDEIVGRSRVTSYITNANAHIPGYNNIHTDYQTNGYRTCRFVINLGINTYRLFNLTKLLRSAGMPLYSVNYLPNHTNHYNTIADDSGYSYDSLDDVKHTKLYEIPSVIDNDYLAKYTNHYILNLKDIIIDWEFISGEHEVMMQDLLNVQNIYNPIELGINTKCNINVEESKLNDKLKEIFPDYKGNNISDFNMLDFIDNITYKDTDKIIPKITIINTNKLEPGEFTINIKDNKYIPSITSMFNRSNFFVKLDIITDFKYKYDINDTDKTVLNKNINNISLIFVVNKKNNSVYEFKNINDYEYDTSKSKLFILKSKKLDKMEMIAKEFDKKWLLSVINDKLSIKIDKLLKKSISNSLKNILTTIKNSSILTYEWFINGYDTNNLTNDNIILTSENEIKGSKLINGLISNVDYNYTIKDNMYLSVVKPLTLSVDLNVVPSDSWKLEFIYDNKTLYSTHLLEEPSDDIIKKIWYDINDNENMTIFKENTINMYTNTAKKIISVFAKDILEKHIITFIFKSNVFSKEQRTFNITKYANSKLTEDEFWNIFQSSNIHNYFSTNIPNIIKYYDFNYDTTIIINMNTITNEKLEDIPDIYYGINVNIKIGNNTISKTYYKPNNSTITYKDIYDDLIVPINIEHYLNDNIKRVYYTFDNLDTKITIGNMQTININTNAITKLENTNILFNSDVLPVRKSPIVYDIPIKSTDNVTRLLNSINTYDTEHNTFITNIGDTSIDIEAKYATFFGLPVNNLNIYYSEPLKQVIKRLSLLDDSRLDKLSPRLNEIRRRALIGNMPVTPSSTNIIDTLDTDTKAIDVYNVNITATDVNVYINIPAFYDICYAVNYEPGDMLTVARASTDFNIQNRIKLSFKRTTDINNSKILIAYFRENNPVVNPLIIDVANSSYTLNGNTVNITNTTDITEITNPLKIRGLIKMNDKTLPPIKPMKNSGLWLKQTSAIYDEYTDSEVQFVEDFYPLYHKTVAPEETIALVDNNTRIAYARTSSASCIVFRDGTEFYPISNDISALKILSSNGVLKLY